MNLSGISGSANVAIDGTSVAAKLFKPDAVVTWVCSAIEERGGTDTEVSKPMLMI